MNTEMLNVGGVIEDVVESGLLSAIENILESGLLLPAEIVSLSTNLNNCCESMEAASFMSDEQDRCSVALAVAELLGSSNQDLFDTVWSILCWLHESMDAMMYINFELGEVIRHDLNEAPISKIMPFIELKVNDLFDENRHYKQAVRYLCVLNEILIEKGVR